MTDAAARSTFLPAAGLLAAAALLGCAGPRAGTGAGIGTGGPAPAAGPAAGPPAPSPEGLPGIAPIRPRLTTGYRQDPGALLAGRTMGIAYSGYRDGQHPDRGEGAVNPSAGEILEDLRLLTGHGVRLIRVYDAGETTAAALATIREHELPLQVALGLWLHAEVSNHDGCPWLKEPIPPGTLARNVERNAVELERGIALANGYPEVVVAVSVGNEALVPWTDHMVTVEAVRDYVRRVKGAVEQPVTVADNYAWWAEQGAALADEVDFAAVHTYPIWENKSIEDALPYTDANVASVARALPGLPIAVFDTGWATTAVEFGERASEANQARYHAEVRAWAELTSTTVFFFSAFDEPWKGAPGRPDAAEKNWGLWFGDRKPKLAARAMEAGR